jgi:tetratricopeptide (TPR) repeat protein
MIDHDQGDMDEAFEKFLKAMAIERNTGKKTVSPEILHNIGSIYTSKKEFDKALEMLFRALKLEQQTEDKHGEGMTFSSLGMVALWRNRLEDGLKLFALSTVILRSISHVDLRESEPIVSDLAKRLNYSPEQLEFVLHNVTTSYKLDKGWGLIEAAFGKGRSDQTVS